MCPAHASVIDDPASLPSYSVDILEYWKTLQVEQHKRQYEGWPLTTAMAEQVSKVSFSNVDVAITNSIMFLGGEGGKAPGSGGGGGGAIGPGARAGRGGNGGRTTDFNDEPLSEEFSLPVSLERSDNPSPGGGGGGGGAVGPGAVGGGGGDGGDSARGFLAFERGDTLEIEIGEGGKASRLPGQHGADGGDTVVVVRAADGQIKRTIRVAGGKGAKSGALPEDWSAISLEDIRNGFRISSLFTANSIDFRDGLLFILGGGWGSCFFPSFPFDAIWQVACVANWHHLAPGPIRGMQLCLSNPEGTEVSCLALHIPEDAGKELSYIWVNSIGALFDREGLWKISVRSGGFLLSEMEVYVGLRASET